MNKDPSQLNYRAIAGRPESINYHKNNLFKLNELSVRKVTR